MDLRAIPVAEYSAAELEPFELLRQEALQLVRMYGDGGGGVSNHIAAFIGTLAPLDICVYLCVPGCSSQ